MLSLNIKPNEASITAVARLAAAKGDGDYAFELVKSMRDYGIAPRLRTYDPALMCFCENLEVEKAYEVEEHMGVMGVNVEEPELAALLKVSAETGKGERVYGYLHKLRNMVRSVGESTMKAIEDWFCNVKGREVGEVNWEVGRVEEAVLKNGGGWHGLGWIGKGDWVVKRANVDSAGRCGGCGEQLACVDIDDAETERFAQSVAALALEREVKANFSEFQVRACFIIQFWVDLFLWNVSCICLSRIERQSFRMWLLTLVNFVEFDASVTKMIIGFDFQIN